MILSQDLGIVNAAIQIRYPCECSALFTYLADYKIDPTLWFVVS